MSLSSLLHGGGRRRRTAESHLLLEQQVRAMREDAARLDPCVCHAARPHVEFLVRRPAGALAPVVPLGCPACRIAQLENRLSVLTAPSVAPSPTLVPAAVDVPGSAFATPDPTPVELEAPRIVADTPPGPVNSEAADVNAATQPVPVLPLQRALGLADTASFPAISAETPAPRPVVDVSAGRLEPAAMVPPLADPDAAVGFATADLKAQVSPTDITLRGIPPRFAKTA